MCDHCGCREFGPIAELTADHDAILDLAWRAAAVEGSDPETVTAARNELIALLDLHAMKEELGLYPLLMATGDLAQEQNDALEAEHRSVRDVLQRSAFDRREYFALAAHIEEEELELFPSAMFAFDDDGWDAMLEAHHKAFHHFGVGHEHTGEDHVAAVPGQA